MLQGGNGEREAPKENGGCWRQALQLNNSTSRSDSGGHGFNHYATQASQELWFYRAFTMHQMQSWPPTCLSTVLGIKGPSKGMSGAESQLRSVCQVLGMKHRPGRDNFLWLTGEGKCPLIPAPKGALFLTHIEMQVGALGTIFSASYMISFTLQQSL